MKKTLLSLAAIAALGISANAQTVADICGIYNVDYLTGQEYGALSGDWTAWTKIPDTYKGYKVQVLPIGDNLVYVNNVFGYGDQLKAEVDLENKTLTFPVQNVTVYYDYTFCKETDEVWNYTTDDKLSPVVATIEEVDGAWTINMGEFVLYGTGTEADGTPWGTAYLYQCTEKMTKEGEITSVALADLKGKYSCTTEGYDYYWVDPELDKWHDYAETSEVTINTNAEGDVEIAGLLEGELTIKGKYLAPGVVVFDAQTANVSGYDYTFCSQNNAYNNPVEPVVLANVGDGLQMNNWELTYTFEDGSISYYFRDLESTFTRTGDLDEPDLPDSGIASVGNDAAAPEYFNLQGVRMQGNNLPAGIYIMRQGSEVSKVLVK